MKSSKMGGWTARIASSLLATLFVAGVPAGAGAAPAAAPTGPEPIVIGETTVKPSITAAARAEGRLDKLNRVADALNSQFTDAIHGTRKFRIIAEAELPALLEEMKKGALTAGGGPAVGNLRAPKYKVVCTIDDFQDIATKLQDEGHDSVVGSRRIRLSCVTGLFDISTGELRESMNVDVTDYKATENALSARQTGDRLDEMLMTLVKQLAEKSANRVVDVLFPARIIDKTDNVVMINRGNGTAVAVGQEWDAYATGKDLIDPDTGAVIGKKEVRAGRIRITEVLPSYSKADVIEDTGIDEGNLVRPAKPKAGAVGAKTVH